MFKLFVKISFLYILINFLMVFDRLLRVDLSEGSLDLCHRERVLRFSAIKAFISGGKR